MSRRFPHRLVRGNERQFPNGSLRAKSLQIDRDSALSIVRSRDLAEKGTATFTDNAVAAYFPVLGQVVAMHQALAGARAGLDSMYRYWRSRASRAAIEGRPSFLDDRRYWGRRNVVASATAAPARPVPCALAQRFGRAGARAAAKSPEQPWKDRCRRL